MHICSCSILFLTKVNTRTIRRVLAVSSAHTIYCFVLDRFDSKSFSLVTVIDRIFIVLYADCIVFDLVSSWASAVAPANPLTFKELEKKEKKLSDAVDHTNRMVLNDTKRLNGPTIHGRLYSSGGQPTDTDTESDSESDRSTHTDARAHRDTQICRPPDRPSGCSRSLQRQSESRSESERDRESERESKCVYLHMCLYLYLGALAKNRRRGQPKSKWIPKNVLPASWCWWCCSWCCLCCWCCSQWPLQALGETMYLCVYVRVYVSLRLCVCWRCKRSRLEFNARIKINLLQLSGPARAALALSASICS